MAKDYAKVYRGENVMKRGIATYKDEAIFLSQDTLRRDMETLKGRPVVIKHQNVTPENMEEKAVGYVINNTEVYDRLYQYDIAAFEGDYMYNTKGNDIIYKNTYTSIEGDKVAAVGTYFYAANQNYKITIFVNSKQVYTQSGKSKFKGFETVKLNKKSCCRQKC